MLFRSGGVYTILLHLTYLFAIFVMMKQMLSKIIYRFIYLIDHNSLFIHTIVNVIFYISIYIFIFKYDRGNIVGFIFSLSLSFFMGLFVFDKFKFSDNIYIAFLQKSIVFNVILMVFGVIFIYFFDFFILRHIQDVYCDTGDDENKIMDALNSSSNTNTNTNTKIGRASCRERVCLYV